MQGQGERQGAHVQESMRHLHGSWWWWRRGLGLAASFVGLLSVSACSPAAQPAGSHGLKPFATIEPGRDAEALEAMTRLRRRYATTNAYVDRGTVIDTSGSGGDRATSVGYFRTEFIRGRAFRFRYFEETGALHFAIWASGSKVLSWFDGKVTEEKSVTDAMAAARGITSLSSWLVPTLLHGQDICSSRVAVAGEEDVTCGRCLIVATTSSDVRQHLGSVDVEQNVLRRFREIGKKGENKRGKSNASSDIGTVDELLLTYEPSFDAAAEAQIGADIERPPW